LHCEAIAARQKLAEAGQAERDGIGAYAAIQQAIKQAEPKERTKLVTEAVRLREVIESGALKADHDRAGFEARQAEAAYTSSS
jgi:hypothetical protein